MTSDQAYRALRVRLMSGSERKLALMGLTSASVSAQFAHQLSRLLGQAGQSTTVVDAGLMSQALHIPFETAGAPGLWEWLHDKAPIETIKRLTAVPDLSLIPAGQPDSGTDYPTDMLLKSTFAEKIGQIEADFCLIHTEPILNDPNSALIAASVDGAILLVEKGRSTAAEVQAAKEALAMTQANLLGAVLLG